MWEVLIQSLAVPLPSASGSDRFVDVTVPAWHTLGYVDDEVTQVSVNDRIVIFNCTVSELWDSV